MSLELSFSCAHLSPRQKNLNLHTCPRGIRMNTRAGAVLEGHVKAHKMSSGKSESVNTATSIFLHPQAKSRDRSRTRVQPHRIEIWVCIFIAGNSAGAHHTIRDYSGSSL